MSEGCLSERSYSIYLDRELDAEETRRVEAHLERCALCRERVADLAAESNALRAVLQAEPLAPAFAPAPAPRRVAAFSLAIGAISAVAVAFVSLSAFGWLFGNRLPAAIAWLDPFQIHAPFALLFDAWSVLGDSGDALVQIVAPLSALILLGMMISGAGGRPRPPHGPRTVALLLLLAASAPCLLWPAPALAIDLRFAEPAVAVRAGEVVEQTLVVKADTVTIEGTLRGDLIAIAERVVVSGLLEGNLIGGARRIEVSGRITGSVVVAGERVRISGVVDRNVYAGADQTTLAESGRVGQDLVGLGEGVEISGRVGRDAMTFSNWLDVRGEIGRDLSTRVERAELMSGARIGGDLHATYADDEAGIQIDPGASIAGERTVEPATHQTSSEWDRYRSRDWYVFRVLSFAAAFAFGMVMFRLTPWLFASEIRTGVDLFRLFVIGLGGLVLVPLVLLLVGVTVIGIPLAIVGLAAFATGAYSANIVVAATIGGALVQRSPALDWRSFARPLLAGLAVVFVALALPYLGSVLRFVALALGFGVIVERSFARYRGGAPARGGSP